MNRVPQASGHRPSIRASVLCTLRRELLDQKPCLAALTADELDACVREYAEELLWPQMSSFGTRLPPRQLSAWVDVARVRLGLPQLITPGIPLTDATPPGESLRS